MIYDGIDTTHYYGDQIRRIFMVGVVLMVLGLPLMLDLFDLPLYVGLIAILALSYLAGFTSPRHPLTIWANAATSTVAFVVFEIYALELFEEQETVLFLANQLLAVLFLVAMYFSAKTIRAMVRK